MLFAMKAIQHILTVIFFLFIPHIRFQNRKIFSIFIHRTGIMVGESTNNNGFGKYSSNPGGFRSLSDLGKNINETNNLFSSRPFGPPTGGSVFGGSVGCVTGQSQQGMQFKNATPFGSQAGGLNSKVENAFAKAAPGTYNGGSMIGTGGFGFGGSSSSVIGGHQLPASMSVQSSSAFSFGRTNLAIDGASGPAYGSIAPSFEGSFGSKPTVGGFATVSSRTSNTFGEKSLASGNNNFLLFDQVIASSKPYIPNGDTFTFGSKLPPFGITNTSKMPAFGNTGNAAPATGFAFDGASVASSSYLYGNSAFRSDLMSGSGGNTPSGTGQGVGSKTKYYRPTAVVDHTGKKTGEKLQSVSAMPNYQIRSHEELRWEDHQCNIGINWADSSVHPTQKIGSNTFATLPTGTGSNMPRTTQPFPSFSAEKLAFTTGTGSNMPRTTQPFPSFTAEKLAFNTGTGSNMPHTTQPFPSFSAEKLAFTTPNAHKAKGFESVTVPCRTISPDCCAASRSSVWWAAPQPAQVSRPTTHIPMAPSPFGQSPPSFSGFLKCGKPAQKTEALLGKDPLQMTQGTTFSTGLLDVASISSQPDFNHISPISSTGDVQALTVANPFGTPSASETNPVSLVYSSVVPLGISSMPVICKPTPVRTSSLLTCRHWSRSRIKLAARKPPLINDGPKVPFFISPDEFPCPKKGHSWISARENPKAWMANPAQIWSLRENADARSPLNSEFTSRISSDNLLERGVKDETKFTASLGMRTLKMQDEKPQVEDPSTVAVVSHISDQQTISEEHEKSQLPKLQSFDYYTEPSMEELAAKEKTDPGYLSRVKDFVVGRHGYGHIRFNGETDVRQLDIESILKFNHREVIVYMDETTKPPIGQGLNKPAEISLLNIKVVNKKTGHQCTDGEKADKFKEMLIQKSKNSGADFISYDPVLGEWKFRVPHFGCCN